MARTQQGRRPTQADVARLAGVSQAVISHVLNDTPAISVPPATRQRVLDAMAALGYAPNHAAQSLRRRRTNIVTVLVPSVNPYYADIVTAAQGAAAARGYAISVEIANGPQAVSHALARLRGGSSDGVIIGSGRPNSSRACPQLW